MPSSSHQSFYCGRNHYDNGRLEKVVEGHRHVVVVVAADAMISMDLSTSAAAAAMDLSTSAAAAAVVLVSIDSSSSFYRDQINGVSSGRKLLLRDEGFVFVYACFFFKKDLVLELLVC